MPEYNVLSPVSCGEKFEIGDVIPDGILGNRDVEKLTELGVIELVGGEEAKSSKTNIDTPPKTPPAAGTITDPAKILEYVNSSDQAGLEKIKGVGATTAKAMASHGNFASIDELKELVSNIDWNSIEVENKK